MKDLKKKTVANVSRRGVHLRIGRDVGVGQIDAVRFADFDERNFGGGGGVGGGRFRSRRRDEPRRFRRQRRLFLLHHGVNLETKRTV